MVQLLRCKGCGKYTLTKACECGMEAASPAPPKFSIQDSYAKYRRIAKEETRRKAGLI